MCEHGAVISSVLLALTTFELSYLAVDVHVFVLPHPYLDLQRLYLLHGRLQLALHLLLLQFVEPLLASYGVLRRLLALSRLLVQPQHLRVSALQRGQSAHALAAHSHGRSV